MQIELNQAWTGRLLRGSGLAAVLLVTMPSAWAVGFKSTYPYATEPTLPAAVTAERQSGELPWILRPFRQAHQQSLQRGWQSVAPSLTSAEYEVSRGAFAAEQ